MTQNSLNDLFDYDYMIYQNDDFFKFSIDSVLLAEFVEKKKGQKKFIDLCSGNAPVPMILNKLYGDSIDITGVELQPEIYELGKSSIEYNKITNINYINEDIKNLKLDHTYDVVTCNPPYFIVNDTNLVNDNKVKAIARHEIAVDLEDVIRISAGLLKNQGYFYMVHHQDRLADIIVLLNKYHLGLKKVQPIYNDENSECCFVLIEAIYNGKNYVKIEQPVYLNKYTSYKNIFRK